MNPTEKQIKLYGKLREIADNYHSYSEQMMAIAVFVDTEFQGKQKVPFKYCPQCGEPVTKYHKVWCEYSGRYSH